MWHAVWFTVEQNVVSINDTKWANGSTKDALWPARLQWEGRSNKGRFYKVLRSLVEDLTSTSRHSSVEEVNLLKHIILEGLGRGVYTYLHSIYYFHARAIAYDIT